MLAAICYQLATKDLYCLVAVASTIFTELTGIQFQSCPCRLKDLTAYNMERTITILGTIDNCKKAESLISAKLRASYESDMAQFIPVRIDRHFMVPN